MNFLIVLTLCFFLCLPILAADADKNEGEIRALLAESYIADGDYEKAAAEYRKILKNDPKNIEARVALASILSWNKKYDEALELYDEILSEKEDVKVRLQKARVLGWAREYGDSIREYEKLLEITDNSQIALEKRAKEAYWNNKVKHAIQYYNELIEKEPENIEAMFDLSQIYSYQPMWEKAIEEYKRILDIYPGHFRAKEGLQKAELISGHITTTTGYKFFEADSQDRVSDIKKHTFFNRILVPLNNNFQIDAGYNLTSRSFSDFGDVLENEGRIGFTYLQRPDWWIDGFYNFIEYNRGIDTLHTFGGNLNLRVFDVGVSCFSFERERLENSSKIIREGYYRDNYKQRLDFDVNKRLKCGTDYLYSNYSDGNYKNELGADTLFYLLFEPTRFTINYRYSFRDFDETVGEYFSPRDFSTHTIVINWRHFLNKKEIFFGADDLYYDLKYDLSVDSEDIASHKFSAELNWDINKKLNFNVKVSAVSSSADVYEDKSVMATIKCYF